MPGQQRKSIPDVKPELIKLELGLAIDTFYKQYTLMTQGISILVVGNITVCGYAVSTQSSGIFFLGALLSLGILFAVYRGSRIMLSSLYTAIYLENAFGGSDIDWLATTSTSVSLSKKVINELREISKQESHHQRMESLRKMKPPIFGSGRGIIRLALAITTLVQTVLPFILTAYFDWKLF
jgi:hypothetical protein